VGAGRKDVVRTATCCLCPDGFSLMVAVSDKFDGAMSDESSGSCSSCNSACLCFSHAVNCDLLVGFTAAYDKNSNKSFERHLHAECRSFLYPHSDPVGWANDSANRLLQFQRGIIHSDGNSIDTHLALQGVGNQRQYNLDATGNWVDGGFSGSAPAVENNHDCHPDQQSRTANNLNQIATVDGSPLGSLCGGSTSMNWCSKQSVLSPDRRALGNIVADVEMSMLHANGSTPSTIQHVFDCPA
jgi:hypothetical protein